MRLALLVGWSGARIVGADFDIENAAREMGIASRFCPLLQGTGLIGHSDLAVNACRTATVDIASDLTIN